MVITALILYKGYKEGRYSDISSLVRAVVESLVYGWPGDPSIKKKKKREKKEKRSWRSIQSFRLGRRGITGGVMCIFPCSRLVTALSADRG